ncbi:MAG: hypothetical protein AB2421_20690 [Thermotaleaceae bacterium]
MKQIHYYNEIKEEIKKLNQLVDEALENGTPIIQDEAVMEQNRKVDELIVEIQRNMFNTIINERNDNQKDKNIPLNDFKGYKDCILKEN